MEGDISNLCQFDWYVYQWAYFRDQTENFPMNKEVLGKVLGPASGEGNEMAQWVLKSNGKVVPRCTAVRPLTQNKISSEVEKAKRDLSDEVIKKPWGNSVTPPPNVKTDDDEGKFVEYEDDVESPRVIPTYGDPVDISGNALNQQPSYDKMIDAEVILGQGDKLRTVTVKARSLGEDGRTIGTYYDEHHILNSVVYDVEFPDGEIHEYSTNVIAENLLSQVDDEGFTVTVLIVSWTTKRMVMLFQCLKS